MEGKERGSEKLMKQHLESHTFYAADLEGFINKLQAQNLELTEYFPRGIPNPEVLQASVKTTPQNVGNVIQLLVGNDTVRMQSIRVFPRGIPTLREIHVQFEAVPPFGNAGSNPMPAR